MKVFMSWSQTRSLAVAKALSHALPRMIQAVEPWMSPEIEKGRAWGPEITGQLESARIGVVCLTPENLQEPWINFEVGALSRTKDLNVCTFLLGLKPTDVPWPLAQFQHTEAENKADVFKLIKTINAAVSASGERSLPEDALNEEFETRWPTLSMAIADGSRLHVGLGQTRTDREILEELLELTRSLERARFAPQIRPRVISRLTSNMAALPVEVGLARDVYDFATPDVARPWVGAPRGRVPEVVRYLLDENQKVKSQVTTGADPQASKESEEKGQPPMTAPSPST